MPYKTLVPIWLSRRWPAHLHRLKMRSWQDACLLEMHRSFIVHGQTSQSRAMLLMSCESPFAAPADVLGATTLAELASRAESRKGREKAGKEINHQFAPSQPRAPREARFGTGV